ncbi:MAG: twin-arginine translocation signal domain-containing protein [Desulfotomaculum sp.]|nr:twin-arginine translocation signal domain-containing protein [Desulfotomaculum sp.]
MSKLTRREFLKRSAASSVAAGLILSGLEKPAAAAASASNTTENYGTLIDLTKCDGCSNLEVSKCVSVCREVNKNKFPDPIPSEQIEYYWPRKKKEDLQDKKHLTDRLTPYNWTTK